MSHKNLQNIPYIVEIADISDVDGILTALKANLVEIEDVEKISESKRKDLERNGFLRKEVDMQYYQKLIQNRSTDIYIAKSNQGKILGFASIHKEQDNIKKLRPTLKNLFIDNQDTRDLLIKKRNHFTYLDQISILTEYKRIGIASALIKAIIENTICPIVAFIVKKPLYNKASALWHESNSFILVGTADGHYKGKYFQWCIYIHWNKNTLNQK